MSARAVEICNYSVMFDDWSVPMLVVLVEHSTLLPLAINHMDEPLVTMDSVELLMVNDQVLAACVLEEVCLIVHLRTSYS